MSCPRPEHRGACFNGFMSRCYLALGSNLGDRVAQLNAAVAGLGGRGVRVVRSASVYSTEPKEIVSQPWFLNTVVEVATELDPEALMRVCLEVENACGRERRLPNGPRTLDIDIIFFGDRVVQIAGLTIPHPRYAERRFVLEPLAEIAADHIDPCRGRRVGDLVRQVQDNGTVTPFAEPLL